ncbi:thaumatin-like protein 1 [Rutidosis leptorrhynchoides]|uniref:thaumatin-like protein 1 n=1 Tax=Rutidosis leptorrhynchoides TaxID=125765 RepID=UPI003A98F502
MKIELLIALFLATTLIYGVRSTVFTIKNNCNHAIAPGILTGSGTPVTSGFELGPGASNAVDISGSWSGRVWARYGCSNNGGKFSCASGDCGSGQVECNGAGGAPPATLAEFTLSDASGKDFYDVSNVDGFNLPVSINAQGGGCASTDCSANINAKCPSDLAVKDGSGGTIGCKSACVAFNTDEYCCRGDFGTPQTCHPTDYSKLFKGLCPKAYSYAYDDGSSTFSCATGGNYVITFCP